jgi:phage baseplate assembly protein W
MPETPHFDLPLRIDPRTGHLAEVEQDSLDDVMACVEAVVRTRMGEREGLPGFGITDPALSRMPVDRALLAEQIMASEPRAAVLAEQDPDAFEDALSRLSVVVGLAYG